MSRNWEYSACRARAVLVARSSTGSPCRVRLRQLQGRGLGVLCYFLWVCLWQLQHAVPLQEQSKMAQSIVVIVIIITTHPHPHTPATATLTTSSSPPSPPSPHHHHPHHPHHHHHHRHHHHHHHHQKAFKGEKTKPPSSTPPLPPSRTHPTMVKCMSPTDLSTLVFSTLGMRRLSAFRTR